MLLLLLLLLLLPLRIMLLLLLLLLWSSLLHRITLRLELLLMIGRFLYLLH